MGDRHRYPRAGCPSAGPGRRLDIVAHYLAERVPHLEVIVEEPPSRVELPVGGPSVGVGRRSPDRSCSSPWPSLLRRRGAADNGIVAGAGLNATPYPVDHRIHSVNGSATVALLRAARPDVVVVNGTRIIASTVLEEITCPVINTHAGITPGYRGVHGGYWALVDGRPDQVGTTVHLVDPGIDTGGVLARATFAVTAADSIATYPYLHLAAGLPLLGQQVDRALGGDPFPPGRRGRGGDQPAPAPPHRLGVRPPAAGPGGPVTTPLPYDAAVEAPPKRRRCPGPSSSPSTSSSTGECGTT